MGVPLLHHRWQECVDHWCVKELLYAQLFQRCVAERLGEYPREAGENSQAAKLFRFTSLQQIKKLDETLKDYIHEAIEVELSGAKVEFKAMSDVDLRRTSYEV